MSWRSSAEFDARALGHRGERLRAGAAVDRHHAALDHEPAEDRYPHQLAFDDEQRIVEQRQQREGFPRRLVLGGDDKRPLRNFFAPAHLAIDAGNDAQQHQIDAAPGLGHPDHGAIGHECGRQRHHQPEHRVQVEQHVEHDRANDDQHGLVILYAAVSGSRCRRTTANRYFRYSDSRIRTISPLCNHDSVLIFSETTG